MPRPPRPPRPLVAAFALAALAGSLPVAVHAQDLVSICEKVRHPPVGAWSEFKFVGGREDAATIRMSIVGTERQEGTAYIWLELAMRGLALGPAREGAARETRPMISKRLVASFGPGMGTARAAVMKIGSAPAMEMPLGQGRSGAAAAPTLENCRHSKVVGWESVRVPAGTFRALHIVNPSGRGDSWIDPQLPFALVKDSTGGEQGQRLVLVGHGMGARSQITERPRPFDRQLYMQMIMGGMGRPQR
jgi:hypothetical protein